ncbi:MAG: phenylalanine--tRNA ligase subunit beta [Candidatus Woesearchaeota archaeon]
MPKITFQLNDLNALVGKKISEEELEEMMSYYAKGELESYDEKTDEVIVSLDDTNQPALWSVEGLARLFRHVLGLQKGIPEMQVTKEGYVIEVDPSVKNVRPFISAFVFKGKPLDDYLLKQLIQLQEKIAEGYGRKRQKLSIGLYPASKVKFPIRYTTVAPDGIKFVPLEFSKELTPAEILEQHPKGKEYAWILKGAKRYPLLIDSNNHVLSMAPIINSEFTGKLEVGDREVLFEITGTDEESVYLATNIFAQNLSERGYEIFSTAILYKDRKVISPHPFNEKIRISKEQVKRLLGLDLSDLEIKRLVEKAGYDFSNYTVSIPPYRADIMHPFDVIEDIAIMYNFGRIKPLPLESYTVGCTTPEVKFADKVRELVIGLGCQEILSTVLSNTDAICTKMGVPSSGTVEIENYMSETYSAVRSWLLPMLMEFLSKNKHVDYPQRIFEQGLVVVKSGNKLADVEKLAVAFAHSTADFTEIKQAMEALFRALGVDYTIKPEEHSSFIRGRCGSIYVNKKAVAIIGEISPAVLSAWGIEVPVAALEIDLTSLMESIGKK